MIFRRSLAYSSTTRRARSVRVGHDLFVGQLRGLTGICNPKVSLDHSHASSLQAGRGTASLHGAAAGARWIRCGLCKRETLVKIEQEGHCHN
jgi:hypothetical protein